MNLNFLKNKDFIAGFATVLGVVAGFFGYEVSPESIGTIVENVGIAVAALGGIYISVKAIFASKS